jgi:hypothetical protein
MIGFFLVKPLYLALMVTLLQYDYRWCRLIKIVRLDPAGRLATGAFSPTLKNFLTPPSDGRTFGCLPKLAFKISIPYGGIEGRENWSIT